MIVNIKSIRNKFFDILRAIYTHLAILFNIQHQAKNAKVYFRPIKKTPIPGQARTLPKIIWIYWNSNPPDIVIRCVKLVKDLHPDWQINFLDCKTIDIFVDIDFSDIKAVTPQQQSDAIRFELLERYGGIWLDASIIVFSSFSEVKNLIEKNQVDLLGFYREINLISKDTPVMENWFIAAFAGSPSIITWKNEFYLSLQTGIKDYVDFTKETNPNALANLHDPYYLVCYVAFQNALKNISSYLLFDCDQSAFLYHTSGGLRNTLLRRNKWGKYNLIRNFFVNKAPATLPDMIKLTRSDRDLFSYYLQSKKFTTSSMASHIKNISKNG